MQYQGVVEGFYGRSWSWEERSHMLAFLSEQGFNSYCYAPKNDVYLRKQWWQSWPKETLRQLQKISDQSQQCGLSFGLGFSPYGLFDEWSRDSRVLLKKRLAQIQAVTPGLFAILFDDMQVSQPGLAQTQAEITDFIANVLDAPHFAVCPSYYSFDPILPELFGAMPENYWQQLGEAIDPAVDIFWTGEKVITKQYDTAALDTISGLLQRKPLIWDNSIANDGRKTSPYLHLQAMYDGEALLAHSAGVLVNPMNQAALSELVLRTLFLKGSAAERLAAAIDEQAAELKPALLRYQQLMCEIGRDAITSDDRQTMQKAFAGHLSPVARNIVQWLDGEFQFDPACLT